MSDQPQDEAAPPVPVADRVFLVVVDDSPEMELALRFAGRRARHTGGRVALLRVVEPADFQHWAGVASLMREEAREEAEQLLQRLAAEAHESSGHMPILYAREGDRLKELLKLIEEEPGISILVLATAARGDPGPLISTLTKKHLGKLRIPVTIIPGNLTHEQLDALT